MRTGQYFIFIGPAPTLRAARSIAVDDDRRLRSMLVYGFSRKLNRIVLFDERRDKEEGGGAR